MEKEERQYRPGERVPGTEYVVVRLEAEGGHGALYLVKHHFLEKKIQMLKTLRGFEPSADLIERLKREAQMLAAMDHPHIVSVTSGGLTDERNPRPYFVMERLKGRSLAQILPEAPEGVGVDAALKVTIEVCDALEYVHTRHGVVHRDIKPDNVFLQVTPRNGSITKILDFGVAHMMDLEQRYTKNNLFLGTPRYASPEQIMGDKPSPQTDLYAVGLLLYELLLGHGPFDDATTFATVATAHVKQTPPGFPKTRLFPDGLEELIMSLLRKKAVERPKSAEWLATQLRQIKRAAEAAERVDAEDLNRTEMSPMQNMLTGHRANMTEAGAPLELPSEPTMEDPSSRTVHESPLGYRSTVRLPSVPPQAPGDVDRAAATRSLHVPLPTPNRSDTQEIASARGYLPPGDPNTSPPSQKPDAAPQVVTSPRTLPVLRPVRPGTSAIVAAVLGVVGLVLAGVVVFLATRGSSTKAAAAEALSASVASAAPTAPVASAAPPVPPEPVAAASAPAPSATPESPASPTAAPRAADAPGSHAHKNASHASPPPPSRVPGDGLGNLPPSGL